ncbi:MAG: hypothetical protein GX218_06645 [Clostridiaceae bacterium]|jgi:hypothetical protein|nr:hypothetical protein [Clostridiaceae bacterium]
MALKILACLFMLIDHAGYYFGDLIPYPLYMGMRSIGRLAFPLFAWMVARSIHKTRNPFFYFLRLACFAVVSEVLFRALDLFPALPIYPANVLITFSLSVVLVSGYQLATRSGLDMIASLRPIAPTNNTLPTPPRFDVRINLGGIRLDSRIGLLIGLLMIFLAIMATSWLKSAPCFVPDYDFYGLAAVLTFFIIQERCEEKNWFKRSFQFFLLLNFIFVCTRMLIYGPANAVAAMIQVLSIAAIPIIFSPLRDRRPGRAAKYFFYLFYPLHVLALALLRLLVTR